MKDLARAITAGETDGLVKLVSERRSGRLLGGHVLAARGGELLGEIALAVRLGLPVAELAETIHAYPTLSEAVFWAAFELAKPDDPAMEAVRGVQAPMGAVPPDV
jgi:dihydrolipoamide dehydrogenase